MTLSEQLFETYCSRHGIVWERVPETDSRTPDYELIFGEHRVIVEVKEIARNKEEIESDRVMEERGWGNVLSHTPGERVRKKIASCSPQIKARALGKLPSVLVVFDARGLRHIDPYNIRVAMYGLEQVHFSVPPIGQGRPLVVGMSHGPKRKMTPEANTSISAVGAMFMPDEHTIHMNVYHNRFAAVALPPSLLRQHGVPQLKIEERAVDAASEWQEIPVYD